MKTDLTELIQRLDEQAMQSDPRAYREAIATQGLLEALRIVAELRAELEQLKLDLRKLAGDE